MLKGRLSKNFDGVYLVFKTRVEATTNAAHRGLGETVKKCVVTIEPRDY